MTRRWLLGAAVLLTAGLGLGPAARPEQEPPAPAGTPVPSPPPAVSISNPVDLARGGAWDGALAAGRTLADADSLAVEQALVAAGAADRLGDRAAEERFLVLAAAAGDLAQVAQVELAELVVGEDARRAAGLLLPVAGSPSFPELRAPAAAILARALEANPAAAEPARVEALVATLPRSLARPLELARAAAQPEQRRRRLERLLAESTDDAVALVAAQRLAGEKGLEPLTSWRIGQTFSQHGLFEAAAPILEAVAGERYASVPPWEVAFLCGRAAFRLSRWDEAVAWYQRAVAVAGGGEREAMLEIHRARALELAGRLDEAVAATRRAVGLAPDDDRRLHLARLRLRQGQPELAEQGVARVRGRSVRAEGELMLALHDLAEGHAEAGARRLAAIRQRPFAGTAAVLLAQLAAARQDWAATLAALDGAARFLDPFWGAAARGVMASLPEAERAGWRERCRAAVAGPDAGARRVALQRWAVLETEPAAMTELRGQVATLTGLSAQAPTAASIASRLGGRLWELGLDREAVRFAAAAFPCGSAAAALGSGCVFSRLGQPWNAIPAADAAARMAAPGLPARVLPLELREALYPLPHADVVGAAAARAGVPGPLLAALVREESRWQPEARSPVGARGLTQVMPQTAVGVALKLGQPPPAPDDLLAPEVALDLGAAELARLLQTFAGHRAAALAGYNAGEAQARVWLDQCGPGCDEERLVASIGFAATRGYVAEVLAASAAYAELYEWSTGTTVPDRPAATPVTGGSG